MVKRILILFLVVTFLISASGCVAKTEHNKLLEEKAALEKKCKELSSKETEYKDEISIRENRIRNLEDELKGAKTKLEDELKGAKTKIEDLNKELRASKSKTRNLEKKIAELEKPKSKKIRKRR